MLKEGERLDNLGRKNYKIIQNPKFFSFGIDAVLLAYFAKVKKNLAGVDFCSGSGIIPLLMYARNETLSIKAIEIQSDLCDMAKRSVDINNLNKNIEIIEGDLRKIDQIINKNSIDFITVNPPYNSKNSLKNESDAIAIARHEIQCNINDIALAAKYILKPFGDIFMIHRPERIVDICSIFRENGIEVKIIQLVQSKLEKEPSNILIKARIGAKMGALIPKPIIIYNNKNEYTSLLKEIYDG
jgi:tRNA1Val (adenine37-N6)-methyltransferase